MTFEHSKILNKMYFFLFFISQNILSFELKFYVGHFQCDTNLHNFWLILLRFFYNKICSNCTHSHMSLKTFEMDYCDIELTQVYMSPN